MPPSDNRLTQIDIGSLTNAKPQTKDAKGALFNSISSIPESSRILKARPQTKDAKRALFNSLDSIPESTKSSLPEDAPLIAARPSSEEAKTTKVRTTMRSATSGASRLRTAWDSPWNKYTKIYTLELGGSLVVAVRKAHPVELVSVMEATEETFHWNRQLQHPNIVTALEAFTTDSGLYIVLEHMPVSLEQLVRSPAYPNEVQLAAILGQVVTGLAYLAAEGSNHGTPTCSNILLNTAGDVKISFTPKEDRTMISQGVSRDVKALSSITMELMQKYVKEEGAVGVDNLDRWHSDSAAVGFLSATTSAASVAELLKHPLLTIPWRKESLIGIISLAQVSMRGRYKYNT